VRKALFRERQARKLGDVPNLIQSELFLRHAAAL
jgi:hypothetical protein